MQCGLSLTHGGNRRRIGRSGREKRRLTQSGDSVYVRVLMNDAVQDLEFCKGVDEDGLCPLEAFVESQRYARENGQGDWERCFE